MHYDQQRTAIQLVTAPVSLRDCSNSRVTCHARPSVRMSVHLAAAFLSVLTRLLTRKESGVEKHKLA